MSKNRNPLLDKASLRARRVAMALRRMGKPVTYSQALEVVATQEGHANWHAYRAHALKNPLPGAGDQPISRPAIVQAMSAYLRAENPFRGAEAFERVNDMLNKGYLERAQEVIRNVEAGPVIEPPAGTWSVVALALYADGPDGEVFISKSERIVRDIAEAKEALERTFAGSQHDKDGARPVVYWELLGTVSSIPTISDYARWMQPQMRQANREWLDEWVTDVVVETWTGAINEVSDEAGQDAQIAEAEAHASTLNNDGLEAQLTALTAASRGDWGDFVVRLKDELDLSGWPFQM